MLREYLKWYLTPNHMKFPAAHEKTYKSSDISSPISSNISQSIQWYQSQRVETSLPKQRR